MLKFIRSFTFLMLVVSAFLWQSCGDKKRKLPDVSGIKVELQTKRFDQDLYKADTNNLAKSLEQLQAQYPDFFSFYIDTLMGFGIYGNYSNDNEAINKGFRSFVTYKDYRDLFDTVKKHFPNTDAIDKDLESGFKYLKYYYPEYKVPRVIYFISGLNNWSAITYENILGIGLDMYLGEDYPFYAAVEIPSYLFHRLTPGHAAPNAFKAIFQDRYPFDYTGKTLLDMMLYKGKEYYFLSYIMPKTKEYILYGYTQKQYEWCKENEAQIYNFFVEKSYIYETNWSKIIRYVNDGPFASGMPPESPGNIGTFIGSQIIDAYISKHPEAGLQDIMNLQDAQKVLLESKYKPK